MILCLISVCFSMMLILMLVKLLYLILLHQMLSMGGGLMVVKGVMIILISVKSKRILPSNSNAL